MATPSYSLKGTGIQDATVFRVAVLAEADPRSVRKEIRSQLGAGKPVLGRLGERIRAHLRSFGLPPPEAKLDPSVMHARKKTPARAAGRV